MIDSMPKTRRSQLLFNIKKHYKLLIVLSLISSLSLLPFGIYVFVVNLIMSHKQNDFIIQDVELIQKELVTIRIYADISFIIISILVGISLSGLFYICRKIVYNEVFTLKDYFTGIKKNFKRFSILYGIMGLLIYIIDLCLLYYTSITSSSQTYVFFIIIVVLTIIYGIILMYASCQEVTYILKFNELMLNSIIFTIKSLFPNIVILTINILPLVLLFIVPSYYKIIVIVILLLFYNGFIVLLNSEYTVNNFDNYINIKNKDDANSLYHKGLNN